jgi:RNA polymerase sigma-70 factor (ECF subfamily)
MGIADGPDSVVHLVDRHYEALYRYAYRLSGRRDDAEDLTQETFCKAQNHLGQLRDPARAKPWLFRILRNAYLQRARSDRRQSCIPLDGIGDVAEPLPDPLPEIDPEKLQQALDELPESFRTPIVLFYFEDFGYREIAEQMDLPMGTVMSRLARAKAHLRARLLPDEACPAEGRAFAPSRGHPSREGPDPQVANARKGGRTDGM